ncbi:hypothetical protein SAMN05216386_0912 [Nitrosospira briensis]|uniref:Uncharacterized protein n=1 Tax=Nitrosospira briensis TaxID=35799 RepID=A0A1I4YW54_9PROT|nr:hypothetical protein SAMN05216386_0912 [Nitrosospira briensis]
MLCKYKLKPRYTHVTDAHLLEDHAIQGMCLLDAATET